MRPAVAHAAGAMVARRTARGAVRSGVLWGAVLGLYVAIQAVSYATSYPTATARRALAKEFGSNAGISALVGPARSIDTIGGFTAWKCLTVLAIIGSVWGLLTATKLLRGEEDAGRWELLLAGRTTRRAAGAQALLGLGAGVLAMLAVTGVVVVVAGRSPKLGFSVSGAAYLSVAVVSGAAMFLAVGAVASELCATRRQASSYAAAALGASYALRMVADSGTSLSWLRWLTPLGWVEELQPLTAPNPVAFVPIVGFIGVLGVFAVLVAGRRDLGASLLPDRSRAPARLGLLASPFGLAVRTQRPVLVGWSASLGVYGLLLGSIARSGGSAITSSPSLKRVFERLGVSGPEAYVGLAMLIMAVLLAVVACGQVGAARGEEAAGRLEFLLVRPVARSTWLWGRLGLGAGVLLAGGLVAGLSTWVGALADHAGIGLPTLLVAGINVVPPALVVLGAGALAIGVVPRAAVPVAYALLAWSLLVELVGGITHVSHWVLDTSVLHQMAASPSEPVNWTANGAMVALAALLAALGVAGFARRDVAGE